MIVRSLDFVIPHSSLVIPPTMPFDPSLPAPNSPLESQVIRDQLQALFVLINNIVTVTAAQVDAVNTQPPGSPAQVQVSVSSGTLHFTFDLPQGEIGPGGPPGAAGADGAPGPPFASAIVDSVTTVDPGQPASVSVSFDGTNVHFSFALPRGNDGSTGPQGPPGDVSQPQLDAAISGTSANSNHVGPLGQSADSLYNQQQMQDLINKVDELINALRR